MLCKCLQQNSFFLLSSVFQHSPKRQTRVQRGEGEGRSKINTHNIFALSEDRKRRRKEGKKEGRQKKCLLLSDFQTWTRREKPDAIFVTRFCFSPGFFCPISSRNVCSEQQLSLIFFLLLFACLGNKALLI